jgi:hypothetical protein
LNIQIPVQPVENTFVRLEFHKVEDRWAHSLLAIGPTRTKTLLRSVEGTPDDNYPSSPPLHDINQHSLANGEAMLGVGTASSGHWSIAYSAEERDDRSIIRADLACLLKKPDCANKWLGSTYSIGKLADAQATDHGVRLIVSEAEIEFTANPAFASILLEGDRIVVTPEKFSQREDESTRWMFSIGGVA